MVLILYESPAGYALFKVDAKKLASVDSVAKHFTDAAAAKQIKLVDFQRFKSTADSLKNYSKLLNGAIPKTLSKFLGRNLEGYKDKLLVADKKLSKLLGDESGITCGFGPEIDEVFRVIRFNFAQLVELDSEDDLRKMALGLGHGLSRYKLKFSSEKVDTMIIQAVNLLDELDKEINNYMMRLREWYGWHFPELGKIVPDSLLYTKTCRILGMRDKAKTTDFSAVLPEDLEKEVKQAAQISMGTEINDVDEGYIFSLCDQIVDLSDYRATLGEYLKNRMQAIAPNLTAVVGQLVGARLIAHSGSLFNLAKFPSSTIQILGAEKALFKALRTKHKTPKYGILFHAPTVATAPAPIKGKVTRALAAKAALCIRCDALGQSQNADIGLECSNYMAKRIAYLNSGENLKQVKKPEIAQATRAIRAEGYTGKDQTLKRQGEPLAAKPLGKKQRTQ